MKNNMKNRIIATLLSLLLVATAAVPVMTSLLKPVEVGAGSTEGFTHMSPTYPYKWLAIWPASFIGRNYTVGQRAWWDGDYTPYAGWSYNSTCSYSETMNCLVLSSKNGADARVRINLNDVVVSGTYGLGTSVAATDFSHVRLIGRTEAGANINLVVQVHSSGGGGSSGQNLYPALSNNGNINCTDVAIAGLSGNIDCVLINLTGTLYLYAIEFFASTVVSEANRNSYYNNTVAPYHGALTVNLNSNGGTPSYSPIDSGWGYQSLVVTLPAGPTKTGYTFQHWSDGGTLNVASGGSFSYSTSAVPGGRGSTTFTAVWAANTYTVSYNANGGSVSSTSKTVTYDSAYGTLPTPTAPTGYTFAGWYTAASGGSQVTSSTTVKTASDHTIYAHWTPSTYTVSFDSQGGSSVSSQSATYNLTYGTLPTSTRAGYTFDGWYTEASGGSKVTASTTVSTAGNHTLYAHWTANTNNTITYVSDSATVGTATYTTGTNPTTMAAPVKAGYTFTGWKVTAASGNWTNGATYDANTAVSGSGLYGNVTLTAQWEINTYTITYNANGGSVGSATVTYTTASPTALATPTKAGYTFAGWKPTTSSGGWNSETLYAADWQTSGVYSNITLVAQWTPTPYTVTLKEDENTTSIVNYDVEDIINLPTPTKMGHTFDGWKVTTADGGNWTLNDLYRDNLQIAAGKYGNVTLTAQWTENTYGITYDAVSGDMPNDALESYTYGETPTLPTPTRSGFDFLGWTVTATELDATGWTLNDTVTAVPSGATGAVTLTAQWKSKGIRLYYSIPDGTGTLTATEDYVDISTHKAASGVAVENMTAGYTLEGWYTDSTYETPVDPSWIDGNGKLVADFTDVADPQESYTFYAKVDYVKRHVTVSATCTEDDEQTFIYCITGKPVLDDVFGEQISLLVTVRAGETVNVEMPLGDYVVSEYVDWSWRYDDASGEETKAIEKEVATISRYDSLYDLLFSYTTPVNALWVNDYSVSTGTGKDPDTTA